jgi:hypothetical protein
MVSAIIEPYNGVSANEEENQEVKELVLSLNGCNSMPFVSSPRREGIIHPRSPSPLLLTI